jgi:outer membrane protein, heavy metal efflux system
MGWSFWLFVTRECKLKCWRYLELKGQDMRALSRHLWSGFRMTALLAESCFAQKALSWPEVRDKFEAANPTLRAVQIGIDESRAQEVTAYLRPNPTGGLAIDQINPFSGGPRHSTFGSLLTVASANYLHERQHKRELRLESAQDATKIAISGQFDLERNLLFNLRMVFVPTLQEKAILNLAKEHFSYYDHLLDVNRERYKARAIAQVDLDRLEPQRIQYESDLQTAEVKLRTAKIQLLALLNDRMPVEQFDVNGPFDFSAQMAPLDKVRQTALDTKPDLKAVLQSVDKAKTDHRLAVANGSTDPTFGFDAGRNPPLDQYFGFTELDIDHNEKLIEATRAQVFSDVDSAYATVNSTVILLHPYKERYLQQASRVRDTIAFSYQHGATSLLDFLNAQADYRSVQVNYLNLVASYLNAASQFNLAVGREVLP